MGMENRCYPATMGRHDKVSPLRVRCQTVERPEGDTVPGAAYWPSNTAMASTARVISASATPA